MKNILDVANCAKKDSRFNTGVPLCDIVKKKIRGVLFMDKGVTFTGSEINSVAAFIQAVKAKTIAPRGQRVYPVFDLLNFEETTGEASTGATGNLTTATIRTSNATPSFTIGYSGSEARHKNMSAMEGMSLDFMLLDEQFAVYGTEKEGGIGGFAVLEAYTNTSKFIISDAVNQYSFVVSLANISEYKDNSMYVVTNSGILTAVGVINIGLEEFDHSANVLKLAVIADGGQDLYDLHGAAIAALEFSARNLEDNSVIPVTSVAVDAANKVLTITLDTTAYGLIPAGGQFEISGPDASTLADAGIKPYEIIPATFTK